jgi:hypothetical protein
VSNGPSFVENFSHLERKKKIGKRTFGQKFPIFIKKNIAKNHCNA